MKITIEDEIAVELVVAILKRDKKAVKSDEIFVPEEAKNGLLKSFSDVLKFYIG